MSEGSRIMSQEQVYKVGKCYRTQVRPGTSVHLQMLICTHTCDSCFCFSFPRFKIQSLLLQLTLSKHFWLFKHNTQRCFGSSIQNMKNSALEKIKQAGDWHTPTWGYTQREICPHTATVDLHHTVIVTERETHNTNCKHIRFLTAWARLMQRYRLTVIEKDKWGSELTAGANARIEV